MAIVIKAIFAFWYGTVLSLSFAGIETRKDNIWKISIFAVISLCLQAFFMTTVDAIYAEKVYPLTTHIPLVVWIIFAYKVRCEVAIGAVLSAYICCELPYWIGLFGAIPFDRNPMVEIFLYCGSCVVIMPLLRKYVAGAIYGVMSQSRKIGIFFSVVPFLYYLWSYLTTVYTTYLKENGYAVALTTTAMFSVMFLVFVIIQHQRQEDERMLRELHEQKKAEEEAKQEVIRISEMRNNFFARVSHEIRTPINAVLGIDEMILRESDDPLIIEYANKIKISGQSLLYLINDILDMSKMESDAMELTPTVYEPQKLISDVLLMVESRAQAKGLVLNYNIDKNIPKKLLGDDMRLRQVLINLLSNAIKYTKKGSITLSVAVDSIKEREVMLHVSVKDTGIGIKEEEKELVFDTFKRADLAQNRKVEGAGLGLNITQKLLQLMNSELQLDSVYEKGSDFYFVLPQTIVNEMGIGDFHKEVSADSMPETYKEGFVAPDARILVVDDNDMNLLVFKGLMKNSMMDIRTALSGQDALDILREEKFDMVFMDHMMPEMDGVETLNHINADGKLKENAGTVIVITANAVVGAREEYLEAGFAAYVEKPVTGSRLETVIREFLPDEKIQDVLAAKYAPVGGDSATEPIQVKGDGQPILDQNIGLEYCAGDRDFYNEILEAFLETNFSDMINEPYRAEAWNDYRVMIHGVKSGAKSIGAMRLAELALESEMALKEIHGVEFVKAHHEEVLLEIKQVEDLVRDLLNK